MGEMERPSEFLSLAKNTQADFGVAVERGCNDDGHKAMGTAGRRTVDMLVILHADMKEGFAETLRIPDDTVAKLRGEVVALVQAHVGDAVKRALESRIPMGGDAAPPGWKEIARRFCATLSSSPGAIVGVVGLLAISPSLRELVKALVGMAK